MTRILINPALWIALATLAIPVVMFLFRRRDPLERRCEAAMASGLSVWSPEAVDVAREAGTKPLSPVQLAAIDNGLHEAIHRARLRGYRVHLQHHRFIVVVLKGETHNGTNVFRLFDGEYVAGKCVALDDGVIAIPEHGLDQLIELAKIVEFEAEHVILYHNDRNLFDATEYHQLGEGHPLF